MRAAVTVMGEDGYEGASMRDMASRAGVSVAARTLSMLAA